MNPEAQRVAIAKLLGWKFRPASSNPDQLLASSDRVNFYALDIVPNYPSDLDAMAEARDHCVTTPELKVRWVNTLRDVVGETCPRRNKAGHPLVSDVDLLFATAPQLAKALLKTVNSWTP